MTLKFDRDMTMYVDGHVIEDNLVGGKISLNEYLEGKVSLATKGDTSLVPNKGFTSFSELKAELGLPGEGNAWHHIVEQSQMYKSGFSSNQVNNVNNIISIPNGKGSVHAKISAFYSSKMPFTDGKTVSDWLSGQSFQQ